MIEFGIITALAAVLMAIWDCFWGVGLFAKPKPDPNDWKPSCAKCGKKNRMTFETGKILSSSVRTERTVTRDIPRDSLGRQLGKTEIEITRNIKTMKVEERWKCACGGYGWRWPVKEEEV